MDKSFFQETHGRTTKWQSLCVLFFVHVKAGRMRQEKQELQKADESSKQCPDLSAVNKLHELRALCKAIIFLPPPPIDI